MADLKEQLEGRLEERNVKIDELKLREGHLKNINKVGQPQSQREKVNLDRRSRKK